MLLRALVSGRLARVHRNDPFEHVALIHPSFSKLGKIRVRNNVPSIEDELASAALARRKDATSQSFACLTRFGGKPH